MLTAPLGCEATARTRPSAGGMWRAWLGEQTEPTAIAEQAVELALMTADDCDCLDDMAAVLRGVLHPDWSVADVVDALECLAELAAEASRQELYGQSTSFGHAAEQYRAELAAFARGTR